MKKYFTALFFILAIFLLEIQYVHAKEPRFRSAEYLYNKCKEALNKNNFEDSYCAAYLEGYTGGGISVGLHMLSEANNPDEIMEKSKNNICHDLDKSIPENQKTKWLATFFTDWIDNNQDVIASESSFLKREAFTILFTITTDARFCLNSKKKIEGE